MSGDSDAVTGAKYIGNHKVGGSIHERGESFLSRSTQVSNGKKASNILRLAQERMANKITGANQIAINLAECYINAPKVLRSQYYVMHACFGF